MAAPIETALKHPNVWFFGPCKSVLNGYVYDVERPSFIGKWKMKIIKIMKKNKQKIGLFFWFVFFSVFSLGKKNKHTKKGYHEPPRARPRLIACPPSRAIGTV